MAPLSADMQQVLAQLRTPGFVLDPGCGQLRADGAAAARLREDPLRVLRVLRCAAVYPVQIEAELAAALHAQCGQLAQASAAGLRAELMRLLAGEHVLPVLLDYGDVLAVFIPEIQVALGFDQRSPWHRYDVWEHTARALAAAAVTDPLVRLAVLFHDLGKPACFSQDVGGQGHFYGHARLGAQLARRRLQALGFDPASVEAVAELVALHLDALPAAQAKRWLFRLGAEQLSRLLELKRADIMAHSELGQTARQAELEAFQAALSIV